MSKTRVLLADDHAMLRSGLRLLINTQPDMEVIGEAASFDESIIKQFAIGCYRQPISMEAHSSDDKLQGIALYTDKTRRQFRILVLVFGSGKPFDQRYKDDGKNSSNQNSTSNLSKLYPATSQSCPKKVVIVVCLMTSTFASELESIQLPTMIASPDEITGSLFGRIEP